MFDGGFAPKLRSFIAGLIGGTQATVQGSPVNVPRTSSGAWTLTTSDVNTIQNCNNASAQTPTIPLVGPGFLAPLGCLILFEQLGAGAVTVTGAASVTVNGSSAGTKVSGGQYKGLYARQDTTTYNTWYVVG